MDDDRLAYYQEREEHTAALVEDQMDEQQGKSLGKGSFGEVYELIEVASRHVVAAIKIIELQKVRPSNKKYLQQEIEIFSQTAHSNIVEYYDSYIQNDQLCIVMELCDSSMRKLLDENLDQAFREQFIVSTFVKLSGALASLHALKIAHRDVKPENVLFKTYLKPKLAIFGLSKVLEGSANHSTLGTLVYYPPEGPGSDPFAADVYALGLTLVQLMGYNPQQKIPYSLLCNTYSQDLVEILKKMLDTDPKKRLKMHDVHDELFQLNDSTYHSRTAEFNSKSMIIKRAREALEEHVQRENDRISLLETELNEMKDELLILKH